MSRIVKVELSNFRNIKHIVLDLKNNPSVIEGDNNLGKSSILNAVNWFFTNTLLTDKWGTGENDIDSIIPIDQVKGEFVSVTITFETGIEFTKNYKTSWDSKTGKPKGHTTEGLINGTLSKNMKLWQDELEKEISFTRTLFAFNELRLFTDPLYALQKMDAKELRQLLIALGCEVSNEEVFSALESEGEYNLAPLRDEETKYRGNYYDMRADYKRKVKAAIDSIAIYENQLKLYNDVQDYDKEKYAFLESNIKSLRDTFYNTKDENTSRMIADIDNKINEVKSARQIYKNSKEADLRIKFNEITAKIQNENVRLANLKQDRNKDLIQKRTSLTLEAATIKTQIEAYQNSLENIITSVNAASQTGKRLVEEQRELVVKLSAAKNSTYQDMVTCPVCYNQFALDPAKQTMFEANKQNEIVNLNSKIEKITNDIQLQKESFTKLKKQREDTANEISKLQDKRDGIINEINSLNIQISSNDSLPVDDSILGRLLSEKQNIEQFTIDLSEYDNKLVALEEEKQNLELNSRSVLEEKKGELNDQIQDLELQLDELKIQKSKWATKLEIKKKYDDSVKERNTLEVVLEAINAVIHKTVEMCNQKAYEKTGFKFVMLEETLSETIKEVCYLVVDGVPFKDVNTSRKAIIGTMFITKIKNILEKEQGVPKNDLPILFDKLESISMNTLSANDSIFKDCQFICTRVTEGKEITVC